MKIFSCLTENMIKELIPVIGRRVVAKPSKLDNIALPNNFEVLKFK